VRAECYGRCKKKKGLVTEVLMNGEELAVVRTVIHILVLQKKKGVNIVED
jgi:hypothetical protein